jgi:RHH-type transcriptional regulator, proline utilization regulon repressor / proline dehydrogenase / delta 1-pyrroline-5-carboxylate dehydrogenase
MSAEEPWIARARALAERLVPASAGSWRDLDIQRVFELVPPETQAGTGLFRLAEALARTPDAASRRALVAEHLPGMHGALRSALALPAAQAAVAAVGRKFVYASSIEEALRHAARERGRARRRFSFDMLGEGARTDEDARQGMQRYLAAIEAVGAHAKTRDACERMGVSIKLSSIHSRFDATGWPHSQEEIRARLRHLCAAAAAYGIGLTVDAEESERACLQLTLLRDAAEQTALLRWTGLGTVIQAYRTDAPRLLGQVLDVARQRCERGGARLAVRLVKGAYWDAEVKRAQELGLDVYAVHTSKAATDLSYVHCAKTLLESASFVVPQFATHNPITVSMILALADGVPFELQRLHGMGEALERALARERPALPMRIYAPVGGREHLLAYLVRRLLENGASTSYVRKAARAADSSQLIEEGFAFLSGPLPSNPVVPPTEIVMPERRIARGQDLGHFPTLEALARRVKAHPMGWRAAPLVGGHDAPGAARAVRSPAGTDVVIGSVADATPALAQEAIALAHAYRWRWSATPAEERAKALERLGGLLENDVDELVALCVREAGKTLADALADVREAVDFCRYYAAQARRLFAPRALPAPAGETNELTLHGRGVFACISPWNFPVAIFTGQVAAALAAGNTVVAKPAEQTPLCAHRVSRLILQAGIPAQAFHLLTGPGETIGQAMVEDSRVAGVVFTGSNETAWSIQRALSGRRGPLVPFIAETGGLNALLVDSTALPEQVVDAVVSSAFRSAGQRCSSLRMLYVQDAIAPALETMLAGAMARLRVGDPADAGTDVGPLIDAGAHAALAAYVRETERRWRVIGRASVCEVQAGHFLAPVAFAVDSIRDLPGERFGPILHVARFAIDALDAVIDDINATGYGLTMGVHTRLPGRAEHVRRRAAVGNLYVNRNIIGAVVGMQPFGGEGLSGTGPKAGGPHYLARFTTERVYTVNTAAAGGDLQLVSASGL